MLRHIIPSRTRIKVLQLLFHNPTENYYLRRVVREIDEEVNAVKREFDILVEEKLVTKEKRLNKVFFALNKQYEFYDEFLRIFTKSDPFAQAIMHTLPKLGRVKFIALSLKYSKRLPIKEDEVYVIFVGLIVVPEIELLISEAEKAFGREINFTVMNEDEFTFRKRNTDPFLWRFLRQPKVMLVGSEDELLK
ncbi:MAG: hypothetical protein IPP41_14605 [Rhodocyclaceae bacterium]|nr:hypothetical protein [Rhodocyclaceae bacterium]